MRYEGFSPNAGLTIGSRPGLDGKMELKRAMMTNQERIGKALELLKTGLMPFVKREMHAKYGDKWVAELNDILAGNRIGGKSDATSSAGVQLILMQRKWGEVFCELLSEAEHGCLAEMIDIRSRWIGQDGFSGAETDRALDAATRLLAAISAPQADDVMQLRADLRRLIFAEQGRSKQPVLAGNALKSRAVAGLKPWREAIAPHKDITSGLHWQSEFTADLWKAHLGNGTTDYGNPVEFLHRTHLTSGLAKLLVGAIRRLHGQDGGPLVLLEAGTGCGKTHALLALYHLFSGVGAWDLPGIEAALSEARVAKLPQSVKRVVLVGSKVSPGSVSTKNDGTVVRTLWGELAWQLGGKTAFDRIRPHDEKASNPGNELRKLISDYSPCLILIDEWLPYVRQLNEDADLPAGHLETHLSFVRSLAEAARHAERCLLAVSLPPSHAAESRTECMDEDVGGLRSDAVLARLRGAMGETNSSWTPAAMEESYEIIRHRMFEPLAEHEKTTRDSIARAFAELYRSQPEEFPPECHEASYQNRLKNLYPIHPENFDRFYARWSTLPNFQRSRGVLRFMAAAIGSLWENGDRSPLILPGNLPLDDARVRHELSRCLPEQWEHTIETEIDGPEAMPRQIDNDVAEFTRAAACQRVARAVFLGSAPTSPSGNAGLDNRRIKLACAMPNEKPALFGDALFRLAAPATDPDVEAMHSTPGPQHAANPSTNDRAGTLRSKLDLVATKVDSLVTTETARRQNETARAKAEECESEPDGLSGHAAAPATRSHVYRGRVMLDPLRVGHDAGLVSGEIIFPLSQLGTSSVTVILEIRAEVPGGIPDNVIRAMTETGRKLNFTNQNFENH